MELQDRLKTARKAKKLTQTEVADKVGITQASYSGLERGTSRSTSKLVELANLFDVNATWLATGKGEMSATPTIDELKQKIKAIENKTQSELEPSSFLNNDNPVPIISWVAAGSWSYSETIDFIDEDTEYLPRPANLSSSGFCLRVRGVSMMPEFKPDEIIFVEPQVGFLNLKNGDLVVVREHDNQEATFKQLIIGDTSDDMYLKPLNPDWHEQKMIPKSEWELVGKVVGKWVRY